MNLDLNKTPHLVPILIPVKLLSLEDLKEQAKDLRYLCDKLDPFAPISKEFKVLLGKYTISEQELDPFMITNKLICLLEDTLTELKKRDADL